MICPHGSMVSPAICRLNHGDCPTWHFLPGPFADLDERVKCPHRDQHAAMRRRYEEKG